MADTSTSTQSTLHRLPVQPLLVTQVTTMVPALEATVRSQ